MRLIDADALLKTCEANDYYSHDIINLITNAPTIQRKGWVSVPIELIDKFPELNEYNYTDDDVRELNAWGIELVLSAAPTETESKMTNEEALQILKDHNAWRRDKGDTENIVMREPKIIGEAIDVAIAYMQEQNKSAEQSEPYAYTDGLGSLYFDGHPDVDIPLYTTPQRQQPLKRLSDEVIDSIAEKGESWNEHGGWYFDSDKFANAIMDAMQELNK